MLEPLTSEEWPASIADMEGGFAGRLNVYRTMAHHPDLLRAWTDFRNHVVTRSALGPQFSEIVILRTGFRLGSDYEWQHHVSRGRKVGLSDERIRSMRLPLEHLQGEDATLCAAVDELHASHRLTPATLEALANLVGAKGVLDLMATVAHYSLLGFMLNSLAVPLDDDVAQELAEAPID